MACLIAAVAGSVALAIWLVPLPNPKGFGITQVDYGQLEGWKADLQGQTLKALHRSCAVMARLPAMRAIGSDAIAGYARDWREPCEASKSIDIQDHVAARDFFEVWFEPFLVTYDGDDGGLFTGYYEPTLEGSLTANSQYTTPLLARPKNLVTVKLGEFNREWRGDKIAGQVISGRLRPYATRAEIVAGALRDKGLELVWVNDPIDAFFMHIQGSGRIALPDGHIIRLAYDGQNGHPYTSLGRELIKDGALSRDEVSMQSIRTWLESNPDRRGEMINRNASFIFFRVIDRDGPVGAQNVVLTPQRSLAVDRRFIPLGVPIWLETKVPRQKGEDEFWRRLMVAQDTGGAIRGAVRGDVFWGAGDEAAEVAGRMKHNGRYYMLLPRVLSEGV